MLACVLRLDWLDAPTPADVAPVAALFSDFGREVLGDDEPPMPVEHLHAEVTQTPAHMEAHLLVAVDDRARHRDGATRDPDGRDPDGRDPDGRDPDGHDPGGHDPGGSEVVGAAYLQVEHIAGRDTLTTLDTFAVRRDRRREGIGTCMLDAVFDRTRALGRESLIAYAPTRLPGAMAMAERRGAKRGLTEKQGRAATAELDRDLLTSWVERAPERAGEYSLVSFDGICPDELLEAFAALVQVMNTAPRRESAPEFMVTPEQVRARQESMRDQGNEYWAAVARHEPTGALAGYTELVFPAHQPWLVWQDDTGVDPAHRNRGLGRWLKAVNALRLLDDKPAVTHIETYNAAVNAAMLGINTAMGFRTVAEWQEWELIAR